MLLPFSREPENAPLVDTPSKRAAENKERYSDVQNAREPVTTLSEGSPTDTLVAELLQCILMEGDSGAAQLLDPASRRELSVLLTSVDLSENHQRQALAEHLMGLQSRLQRGRGGL